MRERRNVMKMQMFDFIIPFLQKYLMLRRIAGILPALVLVVYSGVAMLSVEGSVLCFGKDGHVAIEFADACNGSGSGSQLAGMKSDGCGPCKDVKLLGSSAYTKNASHDTQSFPLVSPSPICPSLPLKEYSRKLINLPKYSHDKTLSGLQSVVLMI